MAAECRVECGAGMDDATAFRRASDGFVERARRISVDQWSGPTPCTEWNVRQLVNHVAGEYMWMAELMQGKTIAEVGSRFDGDVLGEEPVRVLADAQREAESSIADPDSMTRTVHLSFGDVPGADYARQMAVDSVIHSWDLARGIGGDERLEAELLDYTYDEMERTAEDWRAGGAFGPAKQPADDSKQAKLIALTGR